MNSSQIVPHSSSDVDNVTKINDDVDEFSNGLGQYLTSLGLPCKNVLVKVHERELVFRNMPNVLESLSDENLSEAYYISKFIASCGAGLFDAALSYLWNETIVNLRQKVSYFDLSYFFSVIGKDEYYREEDLNEIGDWQLVKGCHEVGILSDVGLKHLDHIRDMRNFASAAHPNNAELDGLQVASWLRTCIREVLSKDASPSALITKQLLSNIRNNILTKSDANPINANIIKLPSEIGNSLLIALFGMYTDQKSTIEVRNNISQIAKTSWNMASKKTKEIIGYKYATFSANGNTTKTIYSKEFFEIVEGFEYIPDDLKSIEMRESLEALENAHYEYNNFSNEVPHAKTVINYVRNSTSIPKNVLSYYVKIILICRLGNYYGVSYEARPLYDEMIGKFGNDEINEFLLLLKDKEINVAFDDNEKIQRLKTIASKLKNSTSNAVLEEALDTIIHSPNSNLKNGRTFQKIQKLIDTA